MPRHTATVVCFFFLISAIVCGWLVYFYWCALLLLIRDIFLTFQSGQKVPKTCLFTFGAVSLLLLLCRYVSWLLLFGEDHNSQSSSQSRNLVLEQNSLFFVFSLGFGVLGLVFFLGGGRGHNTLFFVWDPFDCCFDWGGREPVVTTGQIQAKLQYLIALIARWVGRIAFMLKMQDGDLHTAEHKVSLLL